MALEEKLGRRANRLWSWMRAFHTIYSRSMEGEKSGQGGRMDDRRGAETMNYHDDRNGGLQSLKKLRKAINKNYYWTQLDQDIQGSGLVGNSKIHPRSRGSGIQNRNLQMNREAFTRSRGGGDGSEQEGKYAQS
jgi:hypothetical protein